MDPLLLLVNGVVFILLGLKMIRGGLRGTEEASDPVSLGLSRAVSSRTKMSERGRYWSVGLGASILTIGVLNLGRAIILMIRHY
jgi:hypothetical protein